MWIDIMMSSSTSPMTGNGSDATSSSASVTSRSSLTGSEVDPPTSGLNVVESAFIGIVLCLLVVVTVAGNLLVCVTITTDRKLRTATNYFLLSLAVTDLMLGCAVLPVSAFATLNDGVWPLGPVVCNIYVSTDVTLCTASILILFAISLDRYFAVGSPFRYHQLVNTRLVWKVNAAVWFFSAVVGFVPIHLGWNTPDGTIQNWKHLEQCEFQLNIVYVLLIAVGTYFLPLFVMCTVYYKVLRISRRQVKAIKLLSSCSNQGACPPSPVPSSLAISTLPVHQQTSSQTLLPHPPGSTHNGSIPVFPRNYSLVLPSLTLSEATCSPAGSEVTAGVHHGTSCRVFPAARQWSSVSVPPVVRSSLTPSEATSHNGRQQPFIGRESPGPTDERTFTNKKAAKVVSDRKAAVTLASVVAAFAICWVPYFSVFVVKPFLSQPVDYRLDQLTLWLGYANSCVNPFLYAFYSSSFREGFRRVLCRRCLKLHRQSLGGSSSAATYGRPSFSRGRQVEQGGVEQGAGKDRAGVVQGGVGTAGGAVADCMVFIASASQNSDSTNYERTDKTSSRSATATNLNAFL